MNFERRSLISQLQRNSALTVLPVLPETILLSASCLGQLQKTQCTQRAKLQAWFPCRRAAGRGEESPHRPLPDR